MELQTVAENGTKIRSKINGEIWRIIDSYCGGFVVAPCNVRSSILHLPFVNIHMWEIME